MMFGPGFEGIISDGAGKDIKVGRRATVAGWWLLLIILILAAIGRLVQLQVVKGEYNRQLADEQRVRLVQIPAARGLIVDRNEKILVQNKPVFREVKVDQSQGITLKLVDRQRVMELTAAGLGHQIVEGIGRLYPLGEAGVHVLGYVGEASEEELKAQSIRQAQDGRAKVKSENEDSEFRIQNSEERATRNPSTSSGQALKREMNCDTEYQLGDVVGRTGIEEEFDCWLRGENGAQIVEVDTGGRLVRQVGSKPAIPGKRLQLTIDNDLQEAVFGSLEGKIGSVVVSDPRSSQVLAMVSSPSFDPAVFDPLNARDEADKLVELFNDEQRPLVNRAIAAVYPPGSTFKMVTAAAGLESKTIDEKFTYEDTGVVKVGEYEYKNWLLTQQGRAEGVIGMQRALARSTDTFFYKLGEMVGAETMANWAKRFGLGSETGIELPGELPGLVPDPEWKWKTIGEKWWLGNTYHMAIGQGDLLTTPVQVNEMTGVIASGGRRCGLHLVKNSGARIQNSEGCGEVGLSEETLRIIKEGMVGACSPGGTAFPLFDFKPQVACKTGTAEFGPLDEKGHRQTHAWLTAFAPVDEPEVVVTVVLEAGGEGSRDAGPVARRVLEAWLMIQESL